MLRELLIFNFFFKHFFSMDKNEDQGSAVECTAAQPSLTKSPKEEEKSLCVFSASVLLLASVERFGVSRMRDFFPQNPDLAHRPTAAPIGAESCR